MESALLKIVQYTQKRIWLESLDLNTGFLETFFGEKGEKPPCPGLACFRGNNLKALHNQ